MDKRVIYELSSEDVIDEMDGHNVREINEQDVNKICDIVADQISQDDLIYQLVEGYLNDAVEEVCGK